jgi:hypothetical protein
MARGGWTGFLSLRDNGAATSIGTLGQAFKSVTDNFKKGFYQNFNLFTLMKKGIDAVVKSAQELIKESREIVTTSTKFNIPIAQLGELRYVALQSGLGINGLSSALNTLRESFLEGVINPGGEATWMMKKLGIEQGDLIDLTSRTGDGFWKIVDSIRAMSNETDRDIALKAIYKGEWQSVSVIVKKSAEEIQKMKDESHAYNDEATKNNENISKSWDRIGERLKTMGNALTPIMGILAGLVEFITSTVLVVFHTFGFVLERIGTIGKRIFQQIGSSAMWAAVTAKNAAKAMMPASGYSFKDFSKDQEINDRETAEKDAQDDREYREKTEANLKNTYMALNVAADGVRSGMSTMGESGKQVLINAGWKKNRLDSANDDEASDNEEILKLKEKQVEARLRTERANEERQNAISRGADARTIKRLTERANDSFEAEREIAQDITDLFTERRERLKKLKEYYPDAVFEDGKYKAKSEKPKDGPTIQTLPQVEIGLAQQKALREQAVRSFTASIDDWDKWKKGVEIAQLEYQNAQADLIQFMASGDRENVAKRNALINAQRNAQINLQSKERELDNLKQKGVNDERLAAINRNNKAIESQQSRDLFGMKMRGVSAIDQQNVVFRNSVDKLKREQAKLADLASDPMREKEYLGGTGPAAIALKNSIQDLMFESAKEMDSLMAMQFNYVSSDAAKRGMGGGIAMVNNPLEVAKESRDYLKKIYEEVKGTGSFDVVPKYMKGSKGWAMGSDGTKLVGRDINN